MTSEIFISAAHKSSGKTLVSAGLCALFRQRGLKVQAFKKGPDYIDGMWLGQASGQPCFNLDPYLSSWASIEENFYYRSLDSDIRLIEGTKGLFDGVATDGSDSNAELSVRLRVPVLLVIDCEGITRGIAPLLLGYQGFDSRVDIRGVILNRVGGDRHQTKLMNAVREYTDIRVFGAVHNDTKLSLPERHIGLVPVSEYRNSDNWIKNLVDKLSQQISVDSLLGAFSSPKEKKGQKWVYRAMEEVSSKTRITIAVAKDEAFNFYYEDDVQRFLSKGVRLLSFNTLRDTKLPSNIDGLWIGGGFPEYFLSDLHSNVSLRDDIRSQILAGLPAYAECGGLMYLSKSISWRRKTVDMIGVIPGHVHVLNRPIGRGYVKLSKTMDSPWKMKELSLTGHEFHFSKILGLPENQKFAWSVDRGYGVDGTHDGIIVNNLIASYCHLRSGAGSNWVDDFVEFVISKKYGVSRFIDDVHRPQPLNSCEA